MQFKPVTINDHSYESIKKRVQEKLDSGYILHTPIRDISGYRNDYNWREKRGQKYSFAGNEKVSKYRAVVVKQ